MINQPTLIGILGAIPFGLLYIVLAVRKGDKPDLSEFATIFLSVVGAVVGIDFGVRSIQIDLSLIPQLKDQRLPMVLGAIAVTWIAVEQVAKSLWKLAKDGRTTPGEVPGHTASVKSMGDVTS
jgi:hypothetical protein